jgi:hypothetical protein
MKRITYKSKATQDIVYSLLFQLYSHEEVAIQLEECRLIPTFDTPIRDDLEFYTPQVM